MRNHQEETPPSSVKGDDDISGLDEEEFIYIGDADDVLGDEESSSNGSATMDEEDDSLRGPPRDDAEIVFSRHSGSVFCCDLHPDGKIAVTGGEDDKAFIWEVETGNTLFESTSHKDSVIFVGFSFDGAYVATADMSGVIQVRKCTLNVVEESAWPIVFEYEAGDLLWGLWHYGARVLICGASEGEMYVFKIPSGETKVLQGHGAKCESGKMLPDGRRIAAGYGDGTLKIWDLKSEAVVHHIRPDTSHMPLNCITEIDTYYDNNLIITASPRGKVHLMTASTGKIIAQVDLGVDFETVAFTKEPELGYFAMGSLDGTVSVWDVSRQMQRHQCVSAEDDDGPGVTKLFWYKHHLITGCLDGSVRVYDGRSGIKTHELTGHKTDVLDICFNTQQSIILTSSEDRTARIFKFQDNK